MNKITCLLFVLISVWSYAQNCDSNTLNGSYMATNSGDTEQITNTIYAGEYQTVTNILTEEYTFTSSYLTNPDFITIRNADGTAVLAEGDSPLTYTFQAADIPTGEIRVIIHLSNSCDGDNNTHTVTLIKVPTCYKPEDPRVSYLSNKRVDFNWMAPSTGPAPVDYEWEIGLSGFTPGTGSHVVNGSTGGGTNATSGENALMASTTYQVAIRSDCGSGDYSNWLITPNITTLAVDPPANDLCDGAVLVVQETDRMDAASAIGFSGSVVGGAETNKEAEICNSKSANARDDVWYSFVAQTSEVTITLEPLFNGRLSLFSGDCSGLTLLECSDITNSFATEEVTRSGLTIGTTYYFRVYSQGFSASDPNFTLKLWSSQSITDGDGDGYSTAGGDCDDGDNTVYPGAPEICDGVDNDCDGLTDADDPDVTGSNTYYRDSDSDGYGDALDTVQACSAPVGYVSNDTDCDDTNADINPGEVEVPGNDVDENCDGNYLRYVDADADGYGSTATVSSTTATPDTNESNTNDDCDDGNAAINPGATEVAGNDIDENCDGAYLRYVDADGDGYGSTATVSSSTSTPDTNESNNNLDCDDTNAAINPDSTEVAGNDIDEDCDGNYLRYVDADGDGYGTTATVSSSSSTPDTNESNTNDDCDDGNAAINPGATEVAGNDIDENCDGAYLRYVDADDDGYGATTTVSSSTPTPDTNESNNSLDCDDTDAAINPDATEVAGNDIDEDCDGNYLRYVDTDGDGYGTTATVSSSSSTPDVGESNTNDDCNDGNAAINPGATEVAGNDIDEDCDGNYLRYVDADGDGYGSTATVSSSTSTPDTNESNNSLDCDDTNAAINPDATEVAGNDIDEDCDGNYLRYVDTDGDGYGTTATVSSSSSTPDVGESNTNDDCDDGNAAINPGATEVAGNDIDEDCDGNYLRYVDADGDGYGTTATVSSSSSTPDVGESNTNDDCDDGNAAINPGATEVAGNNIDEDCDGNYLRYVDADGDGYGTTATVSSSSSTPDVGESNTNDDCDDGNAAINPGVTEVAGNDIDEDCDGNYLRYVDADGDGFGSTTTVSSTTTTPDTGESNTNDDCDDTDANEYPGQLWYADVDGDGYSSGSSQTACERPLNHYIASELTATSGDCNDNDAAIHPDAIEICDGIDNDCDGQIDEGVQTTYYADTDGDGYGDPASTTQACSVPADYVSNNTDCDDMDANEYPGQLWYADVDGDGYSSGSSQTACERPLNHYIASELTATSGDCNDNDAAIHPDAIEICDGIDNDCDGQIDEGVQTTYYADTDGDGYGDPASTTQACSVPADYVSNNTDCDDMDANEYPGQLWYADVDGDGYSSGSSQTACERPLNHYIASELTA
uniref:putative metal-binding motif-containing protein n=1 Tax=Aestuariivivens sediminicola TaxID=2913560 RepID=UPI002412D00D